MTMPIPPAFIAEGVAAGRRVVDGLVPGADAAGSFLDGVTAARRWISDRHNWIRVLWFSLGFVIATAGMLMATRPIHNVNKQVAEKIMKTVNTNGG